MVEAQYDTLFKLLLIGDSGVGKTCILYRYTEDTFRTTFIKTIGIDYKIKTLEVDGKNVKLQIWDTAGQERFQAITTSYYRGSHGIMLVYDITDQRSFDNVTKWLRSIGMHASSDVERLLVGNKCDLESKRVIPYNTGKEMAQRENINFFETSAKTKNNIDEAFDMLVKQILKNINNKEVTNRQDSISDLEQPDKNKCSC